MPCKFLISIRSNIFFSRSHLGVKTMYNYLYINPPRTEALQKEFGLSKKNDSGLRFFLPEVFIYWAHTTSKQVLGGPGKAVEIDEAKFGKRKYHRGRMIEGQWVFGGIEREAKEVFVVAVPYRTAATLMRVIKERIAPGTTMISDCWSAYDALKNMPEFTHQTVNHSKNFIDPDTAAHTRRTSKEARGMRGPSSQNSAG